MSIIPNYRARILAGIAGSMILFFGICLESAPKLGRLLSREEVATTWIGLSEDELYMFRITLEKSGGGVAAYGFLDEKPAMLNVRSWSYDPQANSHIVIRLSPEPSGVVQLTGDVIGTRLELKVSKADWKRRVFLRQESTLFQRWERLRMAMKEPDPWSPTCQRRHVPRH